MLKTDQACPYCGQYVAIDIAEGMTGAEREERAARKCMCPDAVRLREIEEAVDKLRQVCGEDSVHNGFEDPLNGSAMEACRAAVEWIIDDTCSEVTIQCAQGDVVRLSHGQRTRVKIRRKCQKQMEM